MTQPEREKALAAERTPLKLPRRRWVVAITVVLLVWCMAAHCQRLRATFGPVPEVKGDAK